MLGKRFSPPSSLFTDNSSQSHIHSDHLLSELREISYVLEGFYFNSRLACPLTGFQFLLLNVIIKSEQSSLILNNSA